MDEQAARLHNQALGEAIFASTIGTIMFTEVMKTVPPARVAEMLDLALLVLERRQAQVQGGPGAIEFARTRLAGLVASYSALADQSGSADPQPDRPHG